MDDVHRVFGKSCLRFEQLLVLIYKIVCCLVLKPEEGLSNSKDFLEIVSEISRLNHPNVVELIGYCCEHGQHLLVYEFYKNGSLHLADEFSKPLTWNSRVKIALGTARALE
ncbi:hypothetical protein ACS0TY_011388 [Phlomoides rotata]